MNVLKVAVTGHTRGIGKSIFDTFYSKGHQVTGYSKSNGFDITDFDTQQRILSECKDFDIFVNNAYAPSAQTQMLEQFIAQWNNQSKMIINISSKLVSYTGPMNSFFETYISDKKKQNEICKKRFHTDSPRLLNIMPGLVDTDMAVIFSAQKLSSDTLAKYIYHIVEFKDLISTQEVIVDVPGLNWADVKILGLKD